MHGVLFAPCYTFSVRNLDRAGAGCQVVNEAFRPQGNGCQPQPQGGQVEGGLGVAQSYHSAALSHVRLTLSLLR